MECSILRLSFDASFGKYYGSITRVFESFFENISVQLSKTIVEVEFCIQIITHPLIRIDFFVKKNSCHIINACRNLMIVTKSCSQDFTYDKPNIPTIYLKSYLIH